MLQQKENAHGAMSKTVTGNPVRDLITNSMSHEYEVFKKKFSKKLSNNGVNDHSN